MGVTNVNKFSRGRSLNFTIGSNKRKRKYKKGYFGDLRRRLVGGVCFWTLVKRSL